MKSRPGFALSELLIVLVFVVIGVIIIGGAEIFFTGDFWVNSSRALNVISLVNPAVVEVKNLERGAWSPTVATVVDSTGAMLEYNLRSNLFWNVKVVE